MIYNRNLIDCEKVCDSGTIYIPFFVIALFNNHWL